MEKLDNRFVRPNLITVLYKHSQTNLHLLLLASNNLKRTSKGLKAIWDFRQNNTIFQVNFKEPIQSLNQQMLGRHHINSDHQKLYQEIRFLQTQNQRLKQQLSDARDLIQINKIEIDVLSKDKSHDKKLIDVIYNYREQIEKLQKKKALLSENCKKLTSEKLVIEQVNQELQSQQKSMEELHKHRIQELSTVIKSLEDKINLCEKNHQNYDSITGFVEKNRDVFNPLEQTLEFKNKEDAWNNQIAYLKDQLNEHKKNQENLLLANGVLRNKVVSLQAKLAMPNKNLGQILDKSLRRLMLYFIQTQKKMLTGDDSDSEEEDLELIAPELIELFPHRQNNSASDIKVPALNILKVRNQQIKGNQKIKEELLRRNHLSKDQKIDRLEVQLQFTRRSLTKNMIELKSEQERRKILQRICEELEDRNELLLKANELNTKKLDKMKRDSGKEKPLSTQKIELLQEQLDTANVLKRQSRRPNLDHQKMRQYEVNKYLQNVETPFEYKLHLELLAKDLNKNEKLKNLETKKMHKPLASNQQDAEAQSKLKRSTSNPFLYFNERRDQIMEVQPQIESKNKAHQPAERMEQTEYMMMGQNKLFKFNEDFDSIEDPDD